jgi:LDH2 family malate/lactate/ureidoglycolate dehydrogenase
MAVILKDITFGEFVGTMSSSLYNTGTIEVTADEDMTILAGQPINVEGVVTEAPMGIAIESVELKSGEKYNIGALTNGFGIVLNQSKLEDRYPDQYPEVCNALEAMGFVFKE